MKHFSVFGSKLSPKLESPKKQLVFLVIVKLICFVVLASMNL